MDRTAVARGAFHMLSALSFRAAYLLYFARTISLMTLLYFTSSLRLGGIVCFG